MNHKDSLLKCIPKIVTVAVFSIEEYIGRRMLIKTQQKKKTAKQPIK
jgi:hypothetical protein